MGRQAGRGRVREELMGKSLAAGMGSVSDDLHGEQDSMWVVSALYSDSC